MKRAGSLGVALLLAGACGGGEDGGGPAPQTGSACTTVAQCYPDVDGAALRGAVECLAKVPGGYCTHQCTTDADCCAAPGECQGGHREVCAPFENQPAKYCFLSCEADDLEAAKLTDADAYCAKYASAEFGCRSTGGGAANRKICAP